MFDSYSRFYDLFNQDKPYKKEIEFVHRWAGKPKSIFDIGCGTGSYWSYYPQGTHIVGIDKSQDMADKGKRIVCGDVTKFKTGARFECVTALFDVLNYIPKHDWWKNIPVKEGGFFIFNILDNKKFLKDGFSETNKYAMEMMRTINPIKHDSRSVDLLIEIFGESGRLFQEIHKMYIHSHADIKRFCGKEFEIVEVKPTKKWMTWYKLIKK